MAMGGATIRGAIAADPMAVIARPGVATIGGPDFGVHGEGFLRLSYANSAENIARALERMGEFLTQRKAV